MVTLKAASTMRQQCVKCVKFCFSNTKCNKFHFSNTKAGFKFNFFDSLLKLASGIIFYLLNLTANLLFHTYKHCYMWLSTLGKNFSRHFRIFFLFFSENRFWHYMQIVSYGDNLHVMSKPVFWENKKNIIIVFGEEIAKLWQQCLTCRFCQLKRIFPTC